MPSPLSSSSAPGGFVPVPRAIFDRLLCRNLSKRELKALLLVARLTYGCRNNRWAHLDAADFQAVGISPNNVGVVLTALLTRGRLIQNGTRREYRLGKADTEELTEKEAGRKERLSLLIQRQLQPPAREAQARSQHEKAGALKLRTATFPKQERSPSQFENSSAAPRWRFCPSRGRFVRLSEPAIDKR